MSRSSVVVGVDAYVGSYAAVDWAACECLIRQATLLLVHSLGSVHPNPAGAGRDDELGHRLLADHACGVRGRYPGLAVDQLLSHLPPAEALIEASELAELVVVGSNGPADVATSILGGVARRVAAGSASPVAVMPPQRAFAALQPSDAIVVGLSPSPAGRAALRFALAEAITTGLAVTAIRAQVDEPPGALLELASEVGRRYPDASFRIVSAETDAASALLVAASNASLIVLGCHNAETPFDVRLGSIPTMVLANAGCPVVVVGVPNPDDEPAVERSSARIAVG